MLEKFTEVIRCILIENNLYKYNYADELLEDAFDYIGFEKFEDLLKNKDFINKLENTDKEILEEAKNSLWEENIEKYDDDQKEIKQEVLKFYNYLKEMILKKN